MKLLITGASGLVGAEIVSRLECLNENKQISDLRISQIIKVSLSPRKDFISADLTSKKGLATIQNIDFDVLIHSAAWRDPDRCLRNKEEATKINYEATKILAEICAQKNAFMLYVSTDYVFDGKNPPYSEDSLPCPINHYGYTKMLGEKAVTETLANFAILRIPLQYGCAAGIEHCPMFITSLKALASKKEWPMEDSIVRYPTYSGDTAEAILFILAKKLNGIFHFSGQDKTTRYKLTLDIAEILGAPAHHLKRLDAPPPGEEERPHDSHLSMNKILNSGFNTPLPFCERIKLLKPLLLDYFKSLL